MTADYKILLDVPAPTAELGFDAYARAFAEIIENSEPQFSIGLFGGWGAGKTTLMHAIREKLGPAVVKVEFSAWRYEREPNLIIPLLDTVREGILAWAEGNAAAAQKAADTAASIRKVARCLIAGLSLKIGAKDLFELSFDAGRAMEEYKGAAADPPGPGKDLKIPDQSLYHTAFRSLSAAFKSFTSDDPLRRLVVFVDDLDRCLPQGALEVLESMKLFFDLPGFVFVVGLDNKVVETMIELRYKEFRIDGAAGQAGIRGGEYIKKIFQVPFHLPPASTTALDSFIRAAGVQAALGRGQIDEINRTVRPHLNFVSTESGMNPRDIKRYINAYTILRKFRPDLLPDVILAVQALSFRADWEILNRNLLAYREAFLEAARQVASNADPYALQNLDDDLASVSPDFLNYVTAPNPGAALLSGVNIREYIYSAASGSVGSQVLDSISDLAKVRGLIRGELLPPYTRIDSQATSQMMVISSSVRSKLSQFINTPLGGSILAELTSVDTQIEAIKDPSSSDTAEQRAIRVKEIDRIVKSLIRRLVSTTQASNPTSA